MNRLLQRAFLLAAGVASMTSPIHAVEPSEVPEQYREAIEQKIDLAEDVIGTGPYRADFADQARHNEAPEWYRDAKFGIYFHWGVYSVPEAGHEWYPCNMHRVNDKKWGIHDHHMKTYGGPVVHPYDKFVPGLTAERFDADEWVELFVKAGAKFAGPVAEHHDGYSMWDSDVTPWNAADTGPKRDITAEMRDAVRHRGLKFITTFHHARNGYLPVEPKELGRHWHYSGALIDYPETLDDPMRAFLYGYMPRERFEQMWLAKLVEVIDAYQPDLIWFDSWLDRVSKERREQFLAYYLNRAQQWNRDVVVTFKQDDMPLDVCLEDFERGRLNELSEHCWLTDDTITDHRSWCYVKDVPVKTTGYLVRVLADIVSKNGCLLLNIAPKADGTIPEDQQEVLLGLGAWLDVHGEAVYATRPWKTFGEGPTRLEKSGGFVEEVQYTSQDLRFTQSKDGEAVYVISLGRPTDGQVSVKAMAAGSKHLRREVTAVEMLGADDTIEWRRDADGLHLSFPVAARGEHAFVWKLTLGETSQAAETQQFPAVMPDEKPTDRELSASWSRMWDRWNPHEDRGNELYSNFKYTPLEGFTREPNVSRRDPSKVLKINDTYYVWYTCRRSEFPPAGLKEATNTVPGTDWDLADIWYATSKDGFTWEERGPAVKRPKAPTQGFRSICTPDVLHWNGRYYLYFQAYSPMVGGQAWCPVMAAVADSPDGPWRLVEKPVIEPGPPGSWDNIKINDPYLLVYQGKIWMYYKGAPVERGDGYLLRMQGAASADDPLGPFTKSPLNPVINSGHETCMWPWKSGVAALVALDGPEKNTIQYAVDGENFEIASIIQMPPIAPGPFIPDAFADSGDGRGITWGLCHINPDGGGATNESILARFDCDLSQDADRPLFKRNNLRFEESTYFQTRVRLPDNLRRMIDHERVKTDRDTIRPLP